MHNNPEMRSFQIQNCFARTNNAVTSIKPGNLKILNLYQIHINTMLFSSKPVFTKLPLSFRFPHQNPVCVPRLPICATRSAYLFFFDLFSKMVFGEQ